MNEEPSGVRTIAGTLTLQTDSGWEHRPLGNLSHGMLAEQGRACLRVLAAEGVNPAVGNRLAQAIDILEQARTGARVPSPTDPEFNTHSAAAMRAVLEAIAIIEARIGQHPHRALFTPQRLSQLVSGHLIAPVGQINDAGANFRFETYIGALLARGGVNVSSAEPDWRIPYFKPETIGLAVKRMNAPTENAAWNLLRDAGHQLRAQSLRGIAVVNVESLIAGIPSSIDAETFGAIFNERLSDLHSRLLKLERYENVIGVMLTGIIAEWVFPASGKPQLFLAFPMQMIGFSDLEPEERFNEFWKVNVVPRMRNTMSLVSGLVTTDKSAFDLARAGLLPHQGVR